MLSKLFKCGVVVVVGAGIVGCESKAGTGALIGGAGGGLVGHSMDQKDKNEARAHDDYERDYDRRHSSSRTTTSNSAVTRDHVIDWTHQGVRDDIIIDRIERSGTVFRMTAADQNELRDHGVSESVIRVMRDTSRR